MENKYSKNTEFGNVRNNKYRDKKYYAGNRNFKRYTGKNSNDTADENYAAQRSGKDGNEQRPFKYNKNGYSGRRNRYNQHRRPFLRLPREKYFFFLKAKPKKTDSRTILRNLIKAVTGNFEMPLLMPIKPVPPIEEVHSDGVFTAIIKDNKIISVPEPHLANNEPRIESAADSEEIKTHFIPVKFGKKNYRRNRRFSFSIMQQDEETLFDALDYCIGRRAFIASHPGPQKKMQPFRNFIKAEIGGGAGKISVASSPIDGGKKFTNLEIGLSGPHSDSRQTSDQPAARPLTDWIDAVKKENDAAKKQPHVIISFGKYKIQSAAGQNKKKPNKYALEAVSAKEEIIELPPEEFIKMTFPDGTPQQKAKEASKRQILTTAIAPEVLTDFSNPDLSPAKTMLEHAAYVLKNEFSVIEGTRIMLGVSGGADSMAMLNIFVQLAPRFRYALYVAHFNHKLRGADSDSDEELVKSTCARYGVKCYCESADIAKAARDMSVSTEEAARFYRYKMYERLAGNLQLDYVATAHNLDDSVETFFLNLMRGTGLKGLSGIPRRRFLFKNTFMIRPMLDFRKPDIYNYAGLVNLEWHEDQTNKDTDFTRNRVRMKLLPMLREEFSPAIFELVKRTEDLIAGADSFIDSYIRDSLPKIIKERRKDGFSYYPAQLDTFPVYIRGELVRRAISEIYKIIPPNSNIIGRIINLKNSESGAVINLNKTIFAAKDRDCITFGLRANVENFSAKITPPGTFLLDNGTLVISEIERKNVRFTIKPTIEFFDRDLIAPDLTVRTWKPGDEFIPIGMQGNMKVSNFLTNQKIPNTEKRSVKVLLSGDKIAWVIGYRIGNSFKVTDKTQNVLKAEFIPNEKPKDEEKPKSDEVKNPKNDEKIKTEKQTAEKKESTDKSAGSEKSAAPRKENAFRKEDKKPAAADGGENAKKSQSESAGKNIYGNKSEINGDAAENSDGKIKKNRGRNRRIIRRTKKPVEADKPKQNSKKYYRSKPNRQNKQ